MFAEPEDQDQETGDNQETNIDYAFGKDHPEDQRPRSRLLACRHRNLAKLYYELYIKFRIGVQPRRSDAFPAPASQHGAVLVEFAVAHVGALEWSDCSFTDVKISDTQKKAIHALTKTYLNREAGDGLQVLVQGKGHGIKFLLYGPPGIGKALTAETLTETFNAPPYTVRVKHLNFLSVFFADEAGARGQIGVEHTRVEKYLKSIFKIASRWKAILLLDEADVFLAERTTDPHINALVSVFSRELERYEGILFLTTNRMQTFNAAILSRIHLALKYEPLKKDVARLSGSSSSNKLRRRQVKHSNPERRIYYPGNSGPWK
ncbi:putative AAA+ ATPase domain-containing protein [Seiridium unicorne]|uniref:AAA+ ATPase domain-containing protein n=1 Tax=Seiridium unicorne TaxID=138068 RepID=A0ABR2UJ51_9PEZI